MNLNNVNQDEFGQLVESHRRELQAHCYRLMGSVQDAEDMVQETFLKAWQRRETFAGSSSLRAWLYKISTNTCLDALKRQSRRRVPKTYQPVSTLAEPIPSDIHDPIWLDPYPDEWLINADHNPEDQAVWRENITLAFITALHLLPPRQRAVLVLCDVLEWQASEVALFMDTTIAAVKSALHRARVALNANSYTTDIVTRHMLNAELHQRLQDYVQAWEQADIQALLALLKADATFSMPPIPAWYQGKQAIHDLALLTIFRGDARHRWRLLPTYANRQPAFGLYRLANGVYEAYGIQVVTIQTDLIADIITFRNPQLVPRFKLPLRL